MIYIFFKKEAEAGSVPGKHLPLLLLSYPQFLTQDLVENRPNLHSGLYSYEKVSIVV